jgi:beta-lactamase regulating signal transducer with metallopeptidase domain
MTTDILFYVLKIAMATVLFYLVYVLIFRKTKFFQLNRLYLIYTSIVVLFIPFFRLSLPENKWEAMNPIIQKTLQPVQKPYPVISPDPVGHVVNPVSYTTSEFYWSISKIVLIFYFAGFIIASILFIRKIFRLLKIVRQSTKENRHGQKVLIHESISTSSFFNYLFWRIPDDEKNSNWVIEHEQVHMQQWHSLDNLIMEILCLVQWFNPVIYLIKKEIKLLHEYIADHAIAFQADRSAYAQLLLDQSSLPQAPLGSTFQSFIGKRLRMLAQKPTPKWKVAFYLSSIPVLVLSVILFSSWVVDDTSLQAQLRKDVHGIVSGMNNEKIIFEWGNFKKNLKSGNLRLLDPTGQVTNQKGYPTYTRILKPAIIEVLEKPLLLKTDGNSKARLDRMEVYVNSEAPSYLIAQDFIDDQEPLLNNQLKEAIAAPGKILLVLSGHVGHSPLQITVELLEFSDKGEYLRWGNYQFDIQKNFRPLVVQKVSWETMAEILDRSRELIKNGISNGGQQSTLMIKDPTTTVVSPWILARKIKNDQEIKHPVILQIIGNDSQTYFAAFDDEENPTLNFETWDEVDFDYFYLEGATINVKEPLWQITWGPLKAVRPPSTYEIITPGAFYRSYTCQFDNVPDFDNGVPLSTLQKMLMAKAELKPESGKKYAQVDITIKHIKRWDLPIVYQFRYQNGRLTGGLENLPVLLKNLEPGDFLDIQDIRPVGHSKSTRLYFKAI